MRLSSLRLRSRWFQSIVGSVVFASAGSFVALPGTAQTLPECAPPNASEYLLLVVNQSPETETQLTQLLPENAAISTCSYLNEDVVRVGGFASLEIANAWAQYLSDMASLQAFVARPAVASTSAIAPSTAEAPAPEATAESTPETPTEAETASSFPSPTQLPAVSADPPEVTAQPSTTAFPTPTQLPANETSPAPTAAAPAASSQGYNPQPLGDGYAVLVDYFSRPEVAADVRQVTAQSVGLVAYEQNPFLLAAHTADSAAADAVLQTLTERGFTAIVVDSRRAILLSPAVLGTEE